MRIVIAPDSFKQSMTARRAAECIQEGFAAVLPDAEYVRIPMADGGEGTVRSLVDATGGRILEAEVHDPIGRPVTAQFGVLGDGRTAVIEMAAASGLELLADEERDALGASTRGTGELILAALEQDVDTILIGIGGSATTDGGAGMVQALGGRLLDADGKDLPPGGGALMDLASIDLSAMPERLREVDVVVACDVENPLTGPTGAAHVFGPQKGADEEQVLRLDAALVHLAEVIRRELGIDVETVPGAGAAGGLGAGLLAFLQGGFRRGIDLVLEHTRLEDALAGADLVVTGEGGIDAQTRFGKTPYGVAQAAARHGVPVIALAGTVGTDATELHDHGFSAIVPIVTGPGSLAAALAHGEENMRRSAETAARLLVLGGRLRPRA